MEKRTLTKLALVGVSVLLSVVAAIWPESEPELQALTQPTQAGAMAGAGQAGMQTAKIKVYVSGAVARPGIYELDKGVRADAAVQAAGGFTRYANRERVNLAKLLKDGMQVHVPALSAKQMKECGWTRASGGAAGEGERDAEIVAAAETSENAGDSHDAGSPEHAGSLRTHAPAASNGASRQRNEKLASAGKVNLNSASAAELETLPGIGPATAQAIIRYRKQQKFGSVNDLLKLKGLGPKKLEKLKGKVTV